MCVCVCVLMALDAALIIFAPLDNLVHKLIKMYLNVSKYSWMRCLKQPGGCWRRLQASSAIWRRIWIICRAATSDKLQATVPTNPSHVPMSSSLPHHFHLVAETCARFDSLMRNKIDWLTATTMEPQPELESESKCPRRVGLVQTLRNLRQLKQTLEIDAPGMLDVARVAAATLMTFCLPASANEDVA